MNTVLCRFCGAQDGRIVLDLGAQPPCDRFPPAGETGDDPAHPLRMWCCSSCGLAQLAEDGAAAEEPRGAEPAALTRQAAEAVAAVAGAGLLPAGAAFTEHGSPHGGSWSQLLAARGMRAAGAGERARVVLDCFGLMHEPDQAAALAARAAELADDGVLLLQYHPLTTIVRHGQWNALRHGHFAYYTTTALTEMLRTADLEPLTAWSFDLYGGTVLLAAGRCGQRPGGPDERVRDLLAEEAGADVGNPAMLARLQDAVERGAAALREWLEDAWARGRVVLGYGAASRVVALLNTAGIGPDLLPAVADASPAKHGRRMPGSRIPVLSPDEALAAKPDELLLFLPDLAEEVRAALPGFEARGGRWVVAEPEPRPLPARDTAAAGRGKGPGLLRRTPAPVTIGLPVHNGEPYLDSALRGLLNQSYGDFELLIGDNCSTDGTEEICRAAERADERVRYLRHPRNVGAVANHNFLVLRSDSPLFGWAAADDEYRPERLRRLVDALADRPGAVLAFSDAEQIDPAGEVLEHWVNDCRVQHPDPVVRLYDLVAVPHPALHLYGLVRCDALSRVGPLPPVGTGDRVLLAALALHGPFAQVDEPLLRHRLHPGQLSERTSAREYLRTQCGGGRRFVLPNVEEGRLYLRAALRAPLPVRERARAMWALHPWLRRNAVPMARNIGWAAIDGARLLAARGGS